MKFLLFSQDGSSTITVKAVLNSMQITALDIDSSSSNSWHDSLINRITFYFPIRRKKIQINPG